MMKIIALLAFAGVATALPSTEAIVPEWDGVDTTLVQVSAFDEASATVQSMITSGKDEGACADLAAATTKEVSDSVDGQQKMLASLDTGADCPNKGQGAVDAAQSALDQANKDKKDADAAGASAASADVNFGPKPLSGLTPGNCEAFFSDPAYTAAKAAEESAKQAATQADGAVGAAEAGLKAAQDAQKDAIAECQCAAKKGYEAAWEAANSNNAANEKAYTKGKHMACVLAGTLPADCDVGAIPKVTAITLAQGTQDANCAAPTPPPQAKAAVGSKNAQQALSASDFTTHGSVSTDGDVITISAGSSYARSKQEFQRPVTVSLEMKMSDGGSEECGVFQVFPQNTHSRHTGYNAGVGWWTHQLGFGVNSADRGPQDGDIRNWVPMEIVVGTEDVKFYARGELYATRKDTGMQSGVVQLGHNCRQFQYRNIRITSGGGGGGDEPTYVESEFAKTTCPAGYERILDANQCSKAYEAIVGKPKTASTSCFAGHPKGCFSHGTSHRDALLFNTCGKTEGSTYSDTVTVCKK